MDFKANGNFSYCLHKPMDLYSTLPYFSIEVASTRAAIMKSDFKYISTERLNFINQRHFSEIAKIFAIESDNFKLCDSTVTSFFQYL